MELTKEESHKFEGGSAQTLPLTYMWVNYFRPNINSFYGVDLYVGQLVREYIRQLSYFCSVMIGLIYFVIHFYRICLAFLCYGP